MKMDKKTFAVRDVSRFLIAFGIIILVLNFNQNIVVYLFGIVTTIIGFLNLFTLNVRLKFIGALDMALAGVYFVLFAVILYPVLFGAIGNLVILVLGLVLLGLSLRFLYSYWQNKGDIRF